MRCVRRFVGLLLLLAAASCGGADGAGVVLGDPGILPVNDPGPIDPGHDPGLPDVASGPDAIEVASPDVAVDAYLIEDAPPAADAPVFVDVPLHPDAPVPVDVAPTDPGLPVEDVPDVAAPDPGPEVVVDAPDDAGTANPCQPGLGGACAPSECTLPSGAIGTCGVGPGGACACLEPQPPQGPCDFALNPMCEAVACDDASADTVGDACRWYADATGAETCTCRGVPAEPCGPLENPGCKPGACSLVDGADGVCGTDDAGACACTAGTPPECVGDADCIRLAWAVSCHGHWDCLSGGCIERCGDPCGNGACDLFTGEDGATCPGDCATITCVQDWQCPGDEYCARPEIGCDVPGTCLARPDACPHLESPVCGCDGATYANACDAASHGVSVQAKGACVVAECAVDFDCLGRDWVVDCTGSWDCEDGACVPACGGTCGDHVCDPKAGEEKATCDDCAVKVCATDLECGLGEFCQSPVGACGLGGTCAARPATCPGVWLPVCGCDGKTWPSACDAASSGVNVAAEGECPPQPCGANTDCPKSQYCARTAGDCDGKGVCVVLPDLCPKIYAPVCGCDGATYDNECFAARSGVNVSHPGACKAPECVLDVDCLGGTWNIKCYGSWDCIDGTCAAVCGGTCGDGTCEPAEGEEIANCNDCKPVVLCKDSNGCAATDYCKKALGVCDGAGTCAPRPAMCPDVWKPVCGCDGATWSNECDAAAAGFSVAYAGECLPPPCASNLDCGKSQYCAKAVGDCKGTGACANRPTVCPLAYIPVCGCDGKTYDNACTAAAAGINVSQAGACAVACKTNLECTKSDFCQKATGDCDGGGTCRVRPGDCPALWAPVCACNGKTYSNECDANRLGFTLASEGMCGTP